MKNKMLFKVFAGILATSLFYSCNTPANSGNDDKGGSGDKNSTQTSNLIKFNFDKASVLATTGLSNKAHSARAADSEQYDSLVANNNFIFLSISNSLLLFSIIKLIKSDESILR